MLLMIVGKLNTSGMFSSRMLTWRAPFPVLLSAFMVFVSSGLFRMNSAQAGCEPASAIINACKCSQLGWRGADHALATYWPLTTVRADGWVRAARQWHMYCLCWLTWPDNTHTWTHTHKVSHQLPVPERSVNVYVYERTDPYVIENIQHGIYVCVCHSCVS